VRVVKETIALLPADHPVRSYLKISGDARFDAVLVDTFLHGRARNYTVDDCLDLVSGAGLAFQGWLLKAPYYHHELLTPTKDFAPAINSFPEAKLWSLMERMHTSNACHFFLACHPERPKKAYTIDFSTTECLDYVPGMRMRCGLAGSAIFRPGWRMSLNAAQLPFVQHIDGRRTIREIAASVAQSKDSQRGSATEFEKFGRKLFQGLWRLDFVTMDLSGTGE
jgi:hypothetical protein